ncbi:MAG: 4-hydroxythreonine-4-phosphate dehydrogenase PdxA [Dissulfurimicrobium sp.]|uniref:4-hydroxythreonine-4-phosphate dehydrogenase PdxA n=1 Tax=Dissulfurimicrobium TaxID=1769732 RepID=UPI003C77D959
MTDPVDRRIKLGITMGCPAGIGPEIIVKAFVQRPLWRSGYARFVPIVLGDTGILQTTAAFLGEDVPISSILSDWTIFDGAINVLPVSNLQPDEVRCGRPTALTGELSYKYIVKALELSLSGIISGIVTAPISKHGLRLAGISYPGHTEMLAEKTNTERYAMMLVGDRLKVVLVTIHCPLKQVSRLLTKEKICEVVSITHEALMHDFGIQRPRIAVAGLNPHGGESGQFGHEEEEVISPAVDLSRAEGIDVTGPYPPDSIFYHAVMDGRFDAVVCQYHDQGLIPFKLLHFKDGVNVTLGLPIIRTSVDHGTAYDIAGTGIADPSSLIAAVELAYRLVCNRKKAGS